MSLLTLKAYNTTFDDYQLAIDVGGIIPTNGAKYTPVIWNLAPFPPAGFAGPGITTVVWPQTYGFSVLSSSPSTGGPVWNAVASLNNQPLGTTVTVSYDKVSDSFKFTPAPGISPPGTLTVHFDKSIPAVSINNVSLGVNINGSPTGALDPKYFQPNHVVTFTVRPTYTIFVGEHLVLGQEVGPFAGTHFLLLDYSGSVNVQLATLLADSTWKSGPPSSPPAARPAVSLSISPYGHLTLDIFHPAGEEETGKEHFRGLRA